MLIIIAFYAGELVWRERDNRLDQISDALPVPTWLPLLSKLGALMLVPVLLQAVLMLCGMAIQAAKGYTRFEPGLYLYDLFDHRPGELLAGLRAGDRGARDRRTTSTSATSSMVVYYVLLLFAGQLGLEHNLYKFGSVPGGDLLRHERLRPLPAAGARVPGLLGRGSVLLLVLACLFWGRGTASSWRERLARGEARASSGPTIGVAGAALLAFVGARRLHLLQHQRPQPLRDDARRAGSCRPTTRSATSRWRPSRSRRSTR